MPHERPSYGGGQRDRPGKIEIVLRLEPALVVALVKIANALAAPRNEITPEMIAAAMKAASETEEKLRAALETTPPVPPVSPPST